MLGAPVSPFANDRRNVDLLPELFGGFVQLSGKPARQALEQEMASPEWKQMTDEERRELVKDTLADFRVTARDALIANHPELGGDAPKPANDEWDQFEDAS